MANNRFAWSAQTLPFTTSGAMGSGSNDSWQIASSFDMSKLTQGSSKRLAVLVSGSVGDFNNFGAPPSTGLLEVALGYNSGLKGLTHRLTLPLNSCVGLYPTSEPGASHGFSFLMVQQASPAITDPDFTATTPTNSGSDLVLWARAIWNDDQPNYGVSFQVRDVQWLVLDMDVLEAKGYVRAVVATDVQLENNFNTYTLVNSDSTALGAAGQTWMQMSSIYQQYRDIPPGNVNTQLRPYFSTGTNDTAAGNVTITNHTTEAEQGIGIYSTSALASSRAANLRMCSSSIGVHDVLTGTHYSQVLAQDRGLLASAFVDRTLVKRSVLLQLRIDLLEHFTRNTTVTSSVSNVVSSNNTPNAYYGMTLNNNPGTVFGTIPIIIGTSDVTSNGSFISRQIQNRLRSSTGGLLAAPLGYYKLYPTERHSPHVVYSTKNVPGIAHSYVLDPFDNVGNATPGDASHPQFFMFHPILDVTNVLTPPWNEQGTVQLTITAEGPLVGTMSALPVLPDIAQPIKLEGVQHGQVRGATGYQRSWPTWIRPRRAYDLTWTALSATDASSVETFLSLNDSFAYTPPHGSATPVVITGDVTTVMLSDGRKTLSVPVVQLLWTA